MENKLMTREKLVTTESYSTNKEMELTIESEYAEEVVAINNGKWNYFEKDNDTFTLHIRPAPGKLEISVKFNAQDHSFGSCLIYKVKGN